eukprot:CAMPEP_0202451578 /NCGR_PEP_ID=MMETSP1360-20130828/9982_1 /ASSEMBLY_ACC=CAM_ASM_000848 /TAXON_ID=515479 /ORGANISM="Licmophora paradoxa, Strain CCMP2313" /LENGTH=852 /DNA_ID=CAMNT_0049070181 /DNA_START=94 /DNA_END=2652 /DNA_ORIENTATION=-
MVEVQSIKDALDLYVPADEAMQEYLEAMLQDDDVYDDLEGLVDAVQPFLDDNRDVAEKLVQAIAASRPQQEKKVKQSVPFCTPGTNTALEHTTHDDDTASASSSSSLEGEKEPSTKTSKVTKAALRKEKRLQKKAQKNNQKKKNKQQESGDDNLQETVARLNAKSKQELNEMDDYASAWEQAKNTDSNDPVIWGGRGFGGRGVNRGLGVYKGKDAVVNQLTLSYGGGRDLLHETHLVIAHGHRYGLMGQNGCGKSTLLKRIASGSVPGWPMHIGVQMVEQEVLGSPSSALASMLDLMGANQGREAQKREELEQEVASLESVLEDEHAEPDALETAAERLSEIYVQLESMDAEDGNDDNNQSAANEDGNVRKVNVFDKLDKKARMILKGLQFRESMLETPGNLLSGGWRMRLALAQALYSEPDILLLDEPTNHLDLSAILFLQDYLVSKNMTIVVVSHDGHFLDEICTDMIKFETNAKLKYHVGNYSSLCEMEEQTWERNTKKAEATARKEKKAMEFIHKQRSMANSKHRDDNKQRQAAERQKKLGRIGLFSDNGQKFKLLAEGNTKKGGSNRAGHIFGNYTNARGMTSAFVSNEKVAFGEDHQLLNFKFPAAAPLKGGGDALISMEDGRFRYNPEDDWLLQNLSLNISKASRIAMVGKNGAGKSTLLKLLCGEQPLNSGEFHVHPNMRIAHIAQHHIEHLGEFLESTPVDYFMKQHHAKSEHEARQFLGGFGLMGPLALQLIGTLSGGQKARLTFATIMFTKPHLLILDEPTNHLDGDSLESLAAAVEKFQGAVVIVSHNQDFLARCSKVMWTVANGRVKVEIPDGDVTTFDDLFENYKEGLRKEMKKRRGQ